MNRTLVSRAFDRSRLQTDDKFDVPTFGKPVRNNHGWVRCDSRSFPGMSYYFNVVTCCSTWVRPVPSSVATPYFRPENRPSDDDFTDKTPLEVSDIEDDEEDEQEWNFTKDSKPLFISKKEARQKKIYSEVLYKMYHCYGDEWHIDVMDKFTSIETDPSLCKCEPIEENASSNDSQSFLPEICYSSSSKSETSDSRSVKNRIRTDSLDSASTLIVETNKSFESTRIKFKDLGYHEKFDSGFMIDYHRPSLTDDLEDNSNEVHFKIEQQNKWSKSISGSEDSDKDSRQIILSSGDDEENDEENDDEEEKDNNNVKHYNCQFSLPKLKAIQFSDLLSSTPKIKIPKKNLRRKRDRSERLKIKEDSENIAPKTAKKMIFELNGVKTINYDFVTPELPPGVKMSNLSDSENSTIFDRRYSLFDRDKSHNQFNIRTKIEVNKISDNDFMDINEPHLSDSSTSISSSQNLRQDTRTDFSNDAHATTDSESSSSSSSCSSNSKNDQKKNFNVARADEFSESDSSETSSTSSSTSAESLETKIKKLPDVAGFAVKLENLETNEWSVSDQKEQTFDEPSEAWTRSNVSRARKDSESSSSSSSSTNSKNDRKKNFNVARADELSESDSSETSSTSSSTTAESLETKIKKLPDVAGFGVKLENLETNEWSVSDRKEQSFDEPSKASTRSNVSHAKKDSESSSSSSTNSKNDQKKNFNVARADDLNESDSSSTSAESLQTKINKLPDISGFVVKLENLDMNEWYASYQNEKSFNESSKSWKAVAGDIFLDSSRSMSSPSNSSDVTWKISDSSDTDED